MINIVAGPPLPPEMIWSRAFSRLLPEISVMHIPQPLSFSPVLPLIFSKRSWAMAFDEENMELSILYIEEKNNLVAPAFVPALPLEDVPQVTCFASPPLQKSAATGRKKKSTPVVETSVRCCTRSTTKRDGFNAAAVLNFQLPQKRKSPRPSPFNWCLKSLWKNQPKAQHKRRCHLCHLRLSGSSRPLGPIFKLIHPCFLKRSLWRPLLRM